MKSKAQLFLLLSLFPTPLLSGQTAAPTVRRDVKHDTSAPLRELARHAAPRGAQAATEAAEARENAAFKNQPDDSAAVPVFGALSAAPAAVGVNMLLNFDGITDTSSWSVPDNDGAVGDTQYVQWVNVQYAVYDKATGRRLLGPLAGTTLWSGFGGTCQTANSGDPIVQFDKIAHRWVLTQHAAPSGSPGYDCVAVSTTPDATGSYYRYAFQLTGFYPDYPKLGVWPDAYYLTIDQLNQSQGYVQVGAMACGLERAAMLAGNAAQAICFTTSGATYHSLLPADMDGTIAPPAGSPNYMLNLGTNALNLWQFHVDFQTPANSTFSGPTSLLVNAFLRACNGRVCVPQAGTTQTLDSVADRLMWRLAYRHFADGHESLVTNHAIGSTNAGVRWYEIQDPGGSMTIVQQGVINPDANYRWMGSIAMDQSGDIAVG